MTRVLQISDLHFGTERPAVVEALLAWVRVQAPDLVVLSGDITQRARRSQFQAARRFIDRLGPAPLVAIPGNHDIPLFNVVARFLAPYGNHCRAFGRELEPCYESPELLVLAVNTTRRGRHQDGEVSPRQVARVARRLEDASAAQLRIVVTHQPVAVLREEDADNVLHGRDRAVRDWAGAGADLILGGHIHLPYVAPLHEQWHDLARPVWGVQAGTAVSSRVRAEADNSVNLIRYHGMRQQFRQAAVERWDYIASASAFQLITTDELEFDAR